MRRVLSIAVICGAMLFATACGSARVVRRTTAGGELALEGERQKAMEDAHRQMQAHCQGPYTIVEEGESVVGTDTAHADESYVTEDGTVVNEGGTSTRQATEWRIKYVCGQAAPAAAPPAPPPAPGVAPGEPAPGSSY